LSSFGLPLLVGASRKRFIASVVASEPRERLGGSIAAHLIAARHGARIIRTHDVAETVQALRVAAAIEALELQIRSSSPASSSMPAMASWNMKPRSGSVS
jgi:dihydropteroate synthase